MGKKRKPSAEAEAPPPAPTLEEIRASWEDKPVNTEDEVTEILGECLWDVFSDNHEAIHEDGRVVDIGSFRGASAFLDEFISGATRDPDSWSCGDHMRFYMGTMWISERADLTPVYQMIFRRLKAAGADWIYYFPELHLIDLTPLKKELEKPEDYSPSEAFAEEQKAIKSRVKVRDKASRTTRMGEAPNHMPVGRAYPRAGAQSAIPSRAAPPRYSTRNVPSSVAKRR